MLPHAKQSGVTTTSVSAGHIIMTEGGMDEEREKRHGDEERVGGERDKVREMKRKRQREKGGGGRRGDTQERERDG